MGTRADRGYDEWCVERTRMGNGDSRRFRGEHDSQPSQRPPRGWLAQGLVGPKHQYITRDDQGEDTESRDAHAGIQQGTRERCAGRMVSMESLRSVPRARAGKARDFRTRCWRPREDRGWAGQKREQLRGKPRKPAVARRSGGTQRAIRAVRPARRLGPGLDRPGSARCHGRNGDDGDRHGSGLRTRRRSASPHGTAHGTHNAKRRTDRRHERGPNHPTRDDRGSRSSAAQRQTPTGRRRRATEEIGRRASSQPNARKTKGPTVRSVYRQQSVVKGRAGMLTEPWADRSADVPPAWVSSGRAAEGLCLPGWHQQEMTVCRAIRPSEATGSLCAGGTPALR